MNRKLRKDIIAALTLEGFIEHMKTVQSQYYGYGYTNPEFSPIACYIRDSFGKRIPASMRVYGLPSVLKVTGVSNHKDGTRTKWEVVFQLGAPLEYIHGELPYEYQCPTESINKLTFRASRIFGDGWGVPS